ncbi:MAG: hypothetical protein K8963_01465 [Proteobacteria bacterium]|nr:hypothetical protein [Pseudomonadota bacterium]
MSEFNPSHATPRNTVDHGATPHDRASISKICPQLGASQLIRFNPDPRNTVDHGATPRDRASIS